jgi:plasmid stabilization system protein ParE
MTIRWLPRATTDLEEILAYVAENLPAFYDDTTEAIFNAIDSLEEMPFRGKPTKKPNIRQLVLPRLPYSIFYKLKDDTIEIRYIRHGARKPR